MSDRDTFIEELKRASSEACYFGHYESMVIRLLLDRMGEPELKDLIEAHKPRASELRDA